MDNNIFASFMERMYNDYVEIQEVYNIAKKLYQSLEKDFRNLDNEVRVEIEKIKYLKSKNSTGKTNAMNGSFLTTLEKEKKIAEKYDLEKELKTAVLQEEKLLEQRNLIETRLDEARLVATKTNILKNKAMQNIEMIKSLNPEKTTSEVNGIYSLELLDMDRKRIAKNIHDSLLNNFLRIIHKSELCFKLLDSDIHRTKLEIQNIQNIAKETINETREIVYDLNPISLNNNSAYELVVSYIKNYIDNTSINISVNEINREQKVEFKSVVRTTILRIVQEAISNILKHANATKVDINLNYDEDYFKMVIRDNGQGFSPESVLLRNKNVKHKVSGYGLLIMNERVVLMGGELNINSESGEGSTLTISIPMELIKEGD